MRPCSRQAVAPGGNCFLERIPSPPGSARLPDPDRLAPGTAASHSYRAASAARRASIETLVARSAPRSPEVHGPGRQAFHALSFVAARLRRIWQKLGATICETLAARCHPQPVEHSARRDVFRGPAAGKAGIRRHPQRGDSVLPAALPRAPGPYRLGSDPTCRRTGPRIPCAAWSTISTT